MRTVFCIYNFVSAKLPLQPWLTVRIVAEDLAQRGHAVHIITDTAEPASIQGLDVHSVRSLRGSNGVEMRELLRKLRPDALVFLPTPLNVATTSWLDGLECRRVGYASYPFYTAAELLTAARCIGMREVGQYMRHLAVPKPIWARAMRRRMDAVVAQSASTAGRLAGILGDDDRCAFIPPGIVLSDWPHQERAGPAEDVVRLLYLGAAVPIRGFDLTLDALARVGGGNIRLRVLARGADEAQVAAIGAEAARRGLSGRVEAEGGWIDRARLIEEIHAADAVLQPFVLVPSELPVTAMEVIACGTPVIGSAIDGLPSTIGPAGTVTAQGSAAALASVVEDYCRDPALRVAWRSGCVRQRAQMQDWHSVAGRWEAVLHG